MGQYGNQPDFGTRAIVTSPTGDAKYPENGKQTLEPAALYIGTGGDLCVTVVGGSNGDHDTVTFKNIPNGTFFPVIVTNIWAEIAGSPATTCSDIIALY